jgi:hypothetical protein
MPDNDVPADGGQEPVDDGLVVVGAELLEPGANPMTSEFSHECFFWKCRRKYFSIQSALCYL